MKYFFLLGLIDGLSISFHGYGQYYRSQNQDTTHKFKQITLTLAPIAIDNGRYYFNGERMKYEELVLPLMSLNDKEINHRVKTARTMKEMLRSIFLAETIYLLQAQFKTPYTQSEAQQLAYTYIGIVVLNELYRLSIQIVRRKAINRYNELVLYPTASFSSIGGMPVGLSARF